MYYTVHLLYSITARQKYWCRGKKIILGRNNGLFWGFLLKFFFLQYNIEQCLSVLVESQS
jgi:hypothetical protein